MYSSPLEVNERCVAALADTRLQEGIKALIQETVSSTDPELASRYSLAFSFGTEGSRIGYPSSICFDDRFSFVLQYKTVANDEEVYLPLAVASFHIRGCRPALIIPPYRLWITQLQGVRQSSSSIAPEIATIMKKAMLSLSWSTLLVRSIVLLARSLPGIDQVWIKKACDNDYYGVSYSLQLSAKSEAQNKRLQERYDRTATECGFVTKELAHVLVISGPSSA